MIVQPTGQQQPPAAPAPVATAGFDDDAARAETAARPQPRMAAALATAARRLTPPQDAWPRVFPGL